MAHSHTHQHLGLVHSHDHHHGPAGDWTDDTARWYAEKFGDWPSQALLLEQLGLSDGVVLVDVGCGTGAFLRMLTARVPAARGIGIDCTKSMVDLARTQTDSDAVTLHEADATALPLDDASADRVVFLNTLHHLADPSAAMREAVRVLRPGGQVWVGTDEDVYDMSGWTNGRVRDYLSAAGLGRIRQTSSHQGDVVLNLLYGHKSG
jgi:ArsR family transcriptional regulator